MPILLKDLGVCCPSCGYSPRREAHELTRRGYETTDPKTREDQLDFFQVCGCDEGNVMCPKCAQEFDSLAKEWEGKNRG